MVLLARFFVPAVALMLVLELPAPSVATAQGKGTVELGMDGFVGVRMYDFNDVFYMDLPVSSVRVGAYVSDRVALEPSLGFDLINVDSETLTQLDFDLGLLFCMEDVGRTTPYFRVGGGVLLVNSELPATTQFSAGLAAGVRIPTGDRFAVRLQIGIDRNFEGDLVESTDLGGKIGFSFFTR